MRPNIPKRRVALVDDETGLLELFNDILSDTYEVSTFDNPKKFLQTLVPGQPLPLDILITDLKMPGMSGVDMIRTAQKMGFYFPSILLSGYLDKQSIFNAVELGVYRLLEKPTTPNIVIEAIEELLVEYDIRDTRHEIRQITAQMREYYSFIRVLVTTHVPEIEVKNFSLQTDSQGEVINQESFDQLMDRLEARLDKLLTSENLLEELRAKRYKNIA